METNTMKAIPIPTSVDLAKTHILLIPTSKIISSLKSVKMKDIPTLHLSLQHFATAYLMANTASFITVEDFLPIYLSNLSLSPYLTEVSSHE